MPLNCWQKDYVRKIVAHSGEQAITSFSVTALDSEINHRNRNALTEFRSSTQLLTQLFFFNARIFPFTELQITANGD